MLAAPSSGGRESKEGCGEARSERRSPESGPKRLSTTARCSERPAQASGERRQQQQRERSQRAKQEKNTSWAPALAAYKQCHASSRALPQESRALLDQFPLPLRVTSSSACMGGSAAAARAEPSSAAASCDAPEPSRWIAAPGATLSAQNGMQAMEWNSEGSDQQQTRSLLFECPQAPLKH